jgi:hypothetical protein
MGIFKGARSILIKLYKRVDVNTKMSFLFKYINNILLIISIFKFFSIYHNFDFFKL